MLISSNHRPGGCVRLNSFNYRLFLLLFISSALHAQVLKFERESSSIPVFKNNFATRSPFSAGLETCQPSLVDLDGDKDFDIAIGDENGAIRFFRNTGSINNDTFVLETNSLANTSIDRSGYATFADIDADGDLDMFVSGWGANGISYYENVGNSTNPAYSFRTQPFQNITATYPTFADIDGDGDVDCFSYNAFYRNRGTKQYANLVQENMAFSFFNQDVQTIAFTDIDKDGDLDAFRGDLNGRVFFYRNTGSRTNPIFNTPGQQFFSIDVGEDSAPCFADIDNDGDPDLFVGTELGKIYFYRNMGTAAVPNMMLITDLYLSLDFGHFGSVALADIEGDQDSDLFAGNEDTNIFFYMNTGSPASPQFTHQTNTFASVNLPDYLSYPTFADIDSDGDLDLFVGEFNGRVFFYKNIGTSRNWNFAQRAQLTTSDLVPIDIARDTKPVFVDIDRDNDLDLFVGNNGNSLYYYRNIGTKTTASFILESSAFLSVTGIGGIAPAFVDIDQDGDYDLFVGNSNGEISFLRNLGTASVPNFSLEAVKFGDIDVGEESIPAFADIDADGDQDLFIAEKEGGVYFYRNVTSFLKLSTGSLDFGSTISSLQFQIINTGKDPLVWTVTKNQNWISVNPAGGTTTQTNVVTVNVDRNLLNPGVFSGNITVNSNGGNKTINVTVTVVNTPPKITHIVLPPIQREQDLQLEASVNDDRGISRVTLLYRKGGEGSFKSTDMTITGNIIVRAQISKEQLTPSGLEYYFTALDRDGAISREPASGYFSAQIVIGNEGVTKDSPQPGGENQNAYRLISLPLDVDNKNPKDVLEDDLGAHSRPEWRLVELTDNQKYIDFPNTSLMTSGKAFWLIVREPGRTIDTGPGKTNRTDYPFKIPLYYKWNFVGDPYYFRIPVGKMNLKSGNALVVRSFEGDWNNPVANAVTEIRPFEGYAVYNANSAIVDTLFINPDLSGSGSTVLKDNDTEPKWSIQILAEAGDSRDIDNFILIHPQASPERDDFDQAEPPVIGDYVSVYFPYPQQAQTRESFCIDVRPEPITGDIWEFEVKSRQRERVDLSFAGLEQVPPRFEVRLVDEALSVSQNLREAGHYSLATVGQDQPKRLKLVVGGTDFIRKQGTKLNTAPSDFELSQNFPNPFNPVTSIRYGLPHAGLVTLKVYDMLGNEIVTLVDKEWKTAGYHVAIWDGRNQKGHPGASGLYFYQLRAGDFSTVRKMAMLR